MIFHLGQLHPGVGLQHEQLEQKKKIVADFWDTI